jgi:hypothetical protein
MNANLIRALVSPEHLGKVMRSLDRTAMVMIIATWVGALSMMGIALYTVNRAHQAQQKSDDAAAVEPLVPAIQKAILPRIELEKLADRLHSRFEKLTFNAMPDNTLEIAASDAAAYLDWLAAMSYLDTIAPQVRWSVRDLCVGAECASGSIMRAVISGERVSFKIPDAPKPEDEPAPKDKKS